MSFRAYGRHLPLGGLLNIPLGAFRVAVIVADFQVTLCLPKRLLVGHGVKTRALLRPPRIVVFKAKGTAPFVQDSSNLH